MSRPKRNYDIEVVGIKLTLVIGEDDDLIDLLRNTPFRLRAITVKSALRGHVQTNGTDSSAAAVDIRSELEAFAL